MWLVLLCWQELQKREKEVNDHGCEGSPAYGESSTEASVQCRR
ncbi:hypothetical protein EV12_3078 [Prochlorococcus sp. MIT 0701]|nr:hypothetical protein EV12_3078 [Prochlorococcus sp. MIT 0701]